MGKLDGRTAFVTGAARGQGRAHAIALAREGARIIGVDLCAHLASVSYPMSTEQDLLNTVGLVEGAGGKMMAEITDVRDSADLTAWPGRLPDANGLPPLLALTAELDVLRDEGECYADLVRASGQLVVSRRYLRLTHGFRAWGDVSASAADAVRDCWQSGRAFLRLVSDNNHAGF
jgi:NAD(P)-dependent dehydrogenase (short-subunit alcohol dehydrogenase family)